MIVFAALLFLWMIGRAAVPLLRLIFAVQCPKEQKRGSAAKVLQQELVHLPLIEPANQTLVDHLRCGGLKKHHLYVLHKECRSC